MAKEIKLDENDFELHVLSIEKARDELTAIKTTIAERDSKSDAMDEFEKRYKELDEFIAKYRTQLDKDVKAMRSAANGMKLTDEAIANSVKKTIGKVLG